MSTAGPESKKEQSERIREIYGIAAQAAGQLSLRLCEAWHGSARRPHPSIEGHALFHAVRLDELCERVGASDRREDSLAPLIAFSNQNLPAETLFDIHAAVVTIPQLFPYSDHERSRLRVQTRKNGEAWGQDMTEREPYLVEKWHDWLWHENPSDRGPDIDRGDASTFTVAADRLSQGLQRILWPDAPPAL